MIKHDHLSPSITRQYRVLVAVIFTIVAAGSYTTLAGLLATEFVEDLGWGVDTIAPGVAINMLLYGLTAPFSIYAMHHYGPGRVANFALFLLVTGSMLILFPLPIVFNLVWGLVIGIGTGCLTMAYGSLIVTKWFPERQGTVAGVLVAASVFGQFALLPVWSEVMEIFSWRAPLTGSALIAVCAICINSLFLCPLENERPATMRILRVKSVYRSVGQSLIAAMKTRVFWTLVTLFVVCGATTNGIMWSHFTLAAKVCGLTVTAASSVLLLIGVFNVFGTTLSGWLSDRLDLRIILAAVFLIRALTLFWLPSILEGVFDVRIVTFAIVFGIVDVATVPPVIAICNRLYGDDGPSVFGWVNAFHQLGAGLMALSGSFLWLTFGSYDPLWITSGLMCLLAAIMVFSASYTTQGTTVSSE